MRYHTIRCQTKGTVNHTIFLGDMLTKASCLITFLCSNASESSIPISSAETFLFLKTLIVETFEDVLDTLRGVVAGVITAFRCCRLIISYLWMLIVKDIVRKQAQPGSRF